MDYRGTEQAAIEYSRTGIIRAKVASSGLQDVDGEEVDGISVIWPVALALERLLSGRISRKIAYSVLGAVEVLTDFTRYCPECLRALPYLPGEPVTLNYWHWDSKERGIYQTICRECRCKAEQRRYYRRKGQENGNKAEH